MELRNSPTADLQASEYKIEWRLLGQRKLSPEKKQHLINELVGEVGTDEGIKHSEIAHKAEFLPFTSLGIFVCSSLTLFLKLFELIQKHRASTVGNMKADSQRIYAIRKDTETVINKDMTIIAEGAKYFLCIEDRGLMETTGIEDREQD